MFWLYAFINLGFSLYLVPIVNNNLYSNGTFVDKKLNIPGGNDDAVYKEASQSLDANIDEA